MQDKIFYKKIKYWVFRMGCFLKLQTQVFLSVIEMNVLSYVSMLCVLHRSLDYQKYKSVQHL